MEKVLITGGNGFLGKYILHALRAKHYNADSLGRQAGNDIICDLATEVPSLPHTYDWVIHAAGKAHSLPQNEAEAAQFHQVNVTGTQHLCDALSGVDKRPAVFIFISSVAVYGREEGTSIDESASLRGNTPYAKSKIEAEQLLNEWSKAYGVKLVILRLPLVAGEDPPGNLGNMIEGIRHGRYFNINGGKAKKSIVMAADIAEYIPRLAATQGVYNLTDGNNPDFAELSALIARQLGKNMPCNIPGWMATPIAMAGSLLGSNAPLNTDKLRKITSTLTFDDSKARRDFGWQPSSVLNSFNIS